MYISSAKSFLIGLLLFLPVHFLGCSNDITQRTFEQQAWKNGDHQLRGQMAQDLIQRKLLIGKTRKEAIKILGQPDEEDKEFVTYFIYLGNEFGPPPLVHIQFDKKQTIKDAWITD